MGHADVRAASRELIASLVTSPWGQVSPSVYETGRLVTLVPWLTGHRQRVAYLLDTQRSDGAWGAPGGYALVPTLSAVEALLTSIRRSPQTGRVVAAADAGLQKLFHLISDLGADDIPDMPALDVITASLLEIVNRDLADLPRWSGRRLSLPASLDGARMAAIRAALAAGASPPEKLLHALEVVGKPGLGGNGIHPGTIGAIGASPAATAAWLGQQNPPDSGNPGRRFLEAVARRYDGPVPCGIPITVFERGWVLTILADAGILADVDVPAEVRSSLEEAAEPGGAAAGEGLPKDADTTSVALYALGAFGAAPPPDVLLAYDAGTHFCTWQGEDGFSTSVNAHVLAAFGRYLAGRPMAAARYAAIAARLSALLRDRQEPDGSWRDRWHASPYYATVCCALALDRFGGAKTVDAVDRAVRWVLSTQRADGSWGRWDGTAEETAYAMQVLLLTRAAAPSSRAAAARGYAYLLHAGDGADGPALWHDKDLYRPAAIVRAAILAALHLGLVHGVNSTQAAR